LLRHCLEDTLQTDQFFIWVLVPNANSFFFFKSQDRAGFISFSKVKTALAAAARHTCARADGPAHVRT
jgi:hypothetical protein